MMRTSCLRLIQQCHQLSIINDWKKIKCEEFISREEVHVHLRNLTMMILLPRKLHMDDNTQGAYLRAAVSRVRFKLSVHLISLDGSPDDHATKRNRALASDLEAHY